MTTLQEPAPQIADLVIEAAAQCQIPVDTAEQVIRHQWKSVVNATQTCDLVEVSGLGYFTLSRHRLKLALARAQKIRDSYERKLEHETRPARRLSLECRLQSCQQLLEKLENRLNGHEDRLERLTARDLQFGAGQKLDQGPGELSL